MAKTTKREDDLSVLYMDTLRNIRGAIAKAGWLCENEGLYVTRKRLQNISLRFTREIERRFKKQKRAGAT